MKIRSPSICFIQNDIYPGKQAYQPSEDYLQCAVDLALLHEISSRDTLLPVISLDVRILSQVDLDMPQRNSFATRSGRILLQNLKVDLCILQNRVLISCKANLSCLFIVPDHLMVLDGQLGRSTTMLGRGRGRDVPFDVAVARDERNIVEIDNLASISA